MLQDFSQFFDGEGATIGRGPAEGLACSGLLSFNLKGETSVEILPLKIFLSVLAGSQSADLCFSRGCISVLWRWVTSVWSPLAFSTSPGRGHGHKPSWAESRRRCWTFPAGAVSVRADMKCKAWTFKLQFLGRVLVQGRSSWWTVSFSQSHREWHGLKCWKFTPYCFCTTFSLMPEFLAAYNWLFEKISEFLSSPCCSIGYSPGIALRCWGGCVLSIQHLLSVSLKFTLDLWV